MSLTTCTMESSLKIITILSCLVAMLTRCCTQEAYSLRLVNNTDSTTANGRVELYFSGEWGSVCPEGWDFFDALIACRQLGFKWVNHLGVGVDKGKGEGPSWLNNVECEGSEPSLDMCPNDGWMEHECEGAASVWCMNKAPHMEVQFFYYVYFATEGGLLIRPYPGSDPFLICDHGWDQADADVICRQKGFPSASRATNGSYFGEHPPQFGPLKYLAVGLQCTGDERSIVNCPADMWFTDKCQSGHEAGVVCNRREEPEGFQIRLVNGVTQYEGLLEIFYNGAWTTIYEESYWGDDFFQRSGLFSIGTVVCRQLGFGYVKDVTTDNRFGDVTVPFAIEGMRCARDEYSLAQCEFHDIGTSDTLAASVAVGFICSGPLPEGRNPIRFAYPGDDDEKHSGRSTFLEIFHDGKWGTICNTAWTVENSHVACRELGYTDIWYGGAGLGTAGSGNTGPILQEGISCKGDEATLDQCELGIWYHHSCSHVQDVYLGCSMSAEDVKYAELSTHFPTTTAAATDNHERHPSPKYIILFLIGILLH